MKDKYVAVTGVSSGIGHGITAVLVERGFHVFGSVRTEADAGRLGKEFGSGFTPLLMDVTDAAAIQRGVAEVEKKIGGQKLVALVNNAGIAFTGPLLHVPLAEVRQQLEVNLIAPLVVVRHFAPLLGTDANRKGKPGRIINMSSVGGRFGAPFLGAYAASKHALEGLSESLRRELLIYGIDVILIEPGYVNTPILDKAEKQDYGAYEPTIYAKSFKKFVTEFLAAGRKGLEPRAVGEIVHEAITTSHPRVCYPVIKDKLTQWTIPRMLPKRVVDRIIGRTFGLR